MRYPKPRQSTNMHAGTSHSKGSHGTSLLCPSKASRTRRASKLDQCAPINALSTKLQCKRHVLDNVGSRVSDLPGWKAKANGSGVYSRSMVMREVARMAWVAVYTSICTVGVTGLEVAATAKTIRTRVDVSSATSSGCQAMV